MALEKWCSYLQRSEFIIRTDHSALAHISDQRLVTPWQRRAYTKLMGLQYKVVYRKGVENIAAGDLSRRDVEVSAITITTPVWLEEVVKGYQNDDKAQTILQQQSEAGDPT